MLAWPGWTAYGQPVQVLLESNQLPFSPLQRCDDVLRGVEEEDNVLSWEGELQLGRVVLPPPFPCCPRKKPWLASEKGWRCGLERADMRLPYLEDPGAGGECEDGLERDGQLEVI